MNGVALAVALASLGVDYSFRTTDEGQIEYTIQIEPEFLKALADGEEIHSDVPVEAGDVQRICVRIGTAPVKHTAASIQQYKRLLVQSPRYASNDPAMASAESQRTILWPARANPEESYRVAYGWQPDQQGQLAYYMQIDPTVLRTLAAGDEIHAAVDPGAGRVARFVVASGTKQLPRVSLPPAAPAPQPLAKSGSRFQTGDDVRQQPTAPPTITDDNYRPSAPRFGDQREQPAADLRAPATTGRAGGGTTFDSSRGEYSQPPAATRPPPTYYPQETTVADNRPYGPTPPSDASRYDRQRPNTIQPPADVAPAQGYNQPYTQPYSPQPYTNQPPPYQEPQTRYSAPAANDRLATAPPSPATAPALTPAPAAADSPASAKDQWWWPYWLVAMFSLFLSIGGNLYLGWTAAEFYSRYRLAVDRIRTAGRT